MLLSSFRTSKRATRIGKANQRTKYYPEEVAFTIFKFDFADDNKIGRSRKQNADDRPYKIG